MAKTETAPVQANDAGAPSRRIKYSCRNLWKVYGPRPSELFKNRKAHLENSAAFAERIRGQGYIGAVCNASFDLYEGEIFVVMGLSGSGKSTLVRCLSRLIDPTRGEMTFDGVDMTTVSERELIQLRRHKMGMVFQSFGLMPHLTVRQNIAFPLDLQGVAKDERDLRVDKVIEMVGLEGREESFPTQLSGGQQQRVGIARSLAVEPDLWFLDEPFSSLDPLIRKQMQDELLRLQGMLKKTIVFITHDFDEALRVADRIAIMRDGFIVQIGTPADLVFRPADDYVAEFTGDVRRDRLLSTKDVMEPAQENEGFDAEVTASQQLSEVLPLFADRTGPFAVVDAKGGVIGKITAHSVLQKLFCQS